MIQRTWALSMLVALLAVVSPFVRAKGAKPGKPAHIPLLTTRQHRGDLEIGGDLIGVPPGETRFVAWADLLKLPQVHATVTGDENFTAPAHVSGVPLASLPSLLGADPGAPMVIAICDDLYNAHYPAAYLAAHAPILVLRINGHDPAHWPLGVDHLPMGPYLITHAHFSPSFKTLSHTEEPQVPWGVVRLDFRRQADVYEPIAPRGPDAQTTAVQQGYTIARENCFRCHARAEEGGTKSKFRWEALARAAVRRPDWFAQYVRDPRSLNPQSQMAASPAYDDATLAALRAYFATFVTAPKDPQ